MESCYLIQQLLVTSMHIWKLEKLGTGNRMYFLYAQAFVTCQTFTSHPAAAWGTMYLFLDVAM